MPASNFYSLQDTSTRETGKAGDSGNGMTVWRLCMTILATLASGRLAVLAACPSCGPSSSSTRFISGSSNQNNERYQPWSGWAKPGSSRRAGI
jgi:hypothetical protein